MIAVAVLLRTALIPLEDEFCKEKISVPTFVLNFATRDHITGKTTKAMSSDECENIARRIQNMSTLPMECKYIKHRPIGATSGSSSGINSGGFLCTPTWEFLDDYSGK